MLAAVASPAFSQSVHGGTLPPLKPVEKTVYDTAYVKVYYEFSYRPDSLSKGGRRSDDTAQWRQGTELRRLFDDRTDFINDSLAAAKRPPMEAFTMNVGNDEKKGITNIPLVIDRSRKCGNHTSEQREQISVHPASSGNQLADRRRRHHNMRCGMQESRVPFRRQRLDGMVCPYV